MTPAERILRAAAAHIERYGWRRHDFGVVGGRCCIMGAVRAVEGPYAGGRLYARAVLHSVVGYGWDDIPNFNDRVCRTKRDAIAALLIAADLASEPWEPGR